MSHKLLVEYQYIIIYARKALIKLQTTNSSYYWFHGFWVSEFQEIWKLVKTSKNSESI